MYESHEFYLIKIENYDKFVKQLEKEYYMDIIMSHNVYLAGMFTIHDDLLGFVSERFQEISSINVSGIHEKFKGINYCGETLFDRSSVDEMEGILNKIIEEVDSTPEGEYYYVEPMHGEGFNKTESLYYFRTLLDYCIFVRERGYYIFHSGI